MVVSTDKYFHLFLFIHKDNEGYTFDKEFRGKELLLLRLRAVFHLTK